MTDTADKKPRRVGEITTEIQRKVGPANVIFRELAREDVNETTGLVEVAIDAVNQFAQNLAAINADASLSTYGKAQKVKPLRDSVFQTIAQVGWQIARDKTTNLAREAALLSVPTLHPQNVAEALVDIECRDWWRSLPAAKRVAELKNFRDTNKFERIEIALLRSPVALVDVETNLIRQSWDERARANNPDEAAAIAAASRAVNWAEDSIVRIAAIAFAHARSGSSDTTRAWLEEFLAKAPTAAREGSWVFGFTEKDLAEAKRRLDAQSRIAA